MPEKVLVVGATGMLGRPVTEQLKADGFEVTVMSSNPQRAEQIFRDKFEIVKGDVTVPESLGSPLSGQDYLYINLNSHFDPVKYQKIEIEGTANLVRAAKEMGLKRVMHISGASSRGKEIGSIYLDAKVRAERALIESGINFTVMRPSWFFETLPKFVQKERATIIGHQPGKIHWLAATDYAAQVSCAFRTEAAANKCFYNFGPEPMTMFEALNRYCQKFYPNVSVRELPVSFAKLTAMLTGNKQLKLSIPFFEYIAERNEDVDYAETDAILGKNTTTIDTWLGIQASSN